MNLQIKYNQDKDGVKYAPITVPQAVRWSNGDNLNDKLSEKADKVANPTSGNFVALDANGNIVDSGHKHSDYLTQHQSLADYIQKSSTSGLVKNDGTIDTTDYAKFVEITYAELVEAKNGGTLTKGAWYRITDYVTTTVQENTQSAGHAFDVIVRADSESVLNENAFAIQHAGDTYFANQKLSAWELKYDINNDTTKYDWADATNGKGVIYYMKDENDNECPYDFKNIQFKVGTKQQAGTVADVFYFTFSVATGTDDATVTDHSLNGGYCYRNKIGLNMISEFIDDYDYYVKRSLNANVFRNMSVTSECTNNSLGNGCNNNSFGQSCGNSLGDNCSNNIFGYNCRENTFGGDCRNNIFGQGCGGNTFGENCLGNSLGNGCGGNSFGDICSYNSFGQGCRCNSLGDNCSNNTFGTASAVKDYYQNIIFENGVKFIQLDCTETTSSSAYCQNVLVGMGIKGTPSSKKTLTVPTAGNAFKTTFKTANDVEIILPFFCKLTLNNDSVVELEGSGELTQAMVSDQYKNTLVSAEIGKLCTSIGQRAFYTCTGLTSINIPSSVISIDNYAFHSCSGLTSITIPDSVTSIGSNAFKSCTGLTSITIPDSVTIIDSQTFQGCTGLTSITIPDSVTYIGISAFSNCTSLTNCTIGSGVTSIGDKAFASCTSLPVVDNIRYADTYAVEAVDKTLTTYTLKEDTRFIGTDAFSGCTSLTSIDILDSVTSIGNYAFYKCSGLTSITIPDSVTYIGKWAFARCLGITSIVIPDSVTSIDDAAFNYCTGLTSITIPDSVTYIDVSVFSNCSSLTSVTIPDSVTRIAESAFNGSGLTSITCNAMTAPTIQGWTFRDVKKGGTLYVPSGSTGYDEWMSTRDCYLGYYNWTKVEQ